MSSEDRKLELKELKRASFRMAADHDPSLEPSVEDMIAEAENFEENDFGSSSRKKRRSPSPPSPSPSRRLRRRRSPAPTPVQDERKEEQKNALQADHISRDDLELLEVLMESDQFRAKLKEVNLNIHDFYRDYKVRTEKDGPVMVWNRSFCPNCRSKHSFEIFINREKNCKVFIKCESKTSNWGQFKAVLDYRINLLTYDPEFDGQREFIEEARKYAREDFDDKTWEVFSIKDKYDFSDYCREMSQFNAKSEHDILLFAATRINRVMAYLPPSEFCVKKNLDDEKFYFVKVAPSLTTKYTKTKGLKTKIVELPHKKLIEKLMWRGLIRLYTTKTVMPHSETPRKTLNMWGGFILDEISEEEYPPSARGLEEMLLFIKNGICGGDSSVYIALMRMLQILIVSPHLKIPWCIYFYTQEKRMGKSFFVNFLHSFVFGKASMKQFAGLKGFLNDHNNWVIGRKLIWIEEAAVSKDDYRHSWDSIKAFISAPITSINPKHVNQFDVANVASLGINSNHKHSVMLEPGDRRYLCPVIKLYRNDMNKTRLFRNLSELTFNFNTGLAFGRYLRETKEFSSIDPMHDDPPLTILKYEMMEYGFMEEHKFVQELALHRILHNMYMSRKMIKNCIYTKKLIIKHRDISRKKCDVLCRPLRDNREKIQMHLRALAPEGKVINWDLLWMNHPDLEKAFAQTNLDISEIEQKYGPFETTRMENTIRNATVLLDKVNLYIGDLETKEENVYDASLKKSMEVYTERDPCEMTSEELYNLYVSWFKIRATGEVTFESKDSKGDNQLSTILKSPKLVDPSVFFKRISGCINDVRRQSGIRKMRMYNLDSIVHIYMNWEYAVDAADLIVKVNKL